MKSAGCSWALRLFLCVNVQDADVIYLFPSSFSCLTLCFAVRFEYEKANQNSFCQNTHTEKKRKVPWAATEGWMGFCRDSHGLTAIQLTQPAAACFAFMISQQALTKWLVFFFFSSAGDGLCSPSCLMCCSLKRGVQFAYCELFSSPPQVVNF